MYSSMNQHKVNTNVLITQIKKHTPSNHSTGSIPCSRLGVTQYAPLNNFSGRLCQFILLSKEYENYHYFISSPISGIFHLFKFICSGGYVVVSHCDFNFMFIITNEVSTFTHILAILFCKMSVQDIYSFLSKGCVSFSLIYKAFSLLSKYQSRIFIPFNPVFPEPRTELGT